MIGRRLVLRLLASAPILGGPRVRPAFAAEPPTPAECAACYRKAFSLFKDLNLNDEEKSRIRHCLTEKLDQRNRTLIDRAEPAREVFRRAATARRCDWADAEEPVIGRDRSDMGNFDIGRLSLLRARFLVQEGRGREALDDAFAVAAFGRHLGTSGKLIQRLFQLAMEVRAITTIAQILPKLEPTERATLPDRIASLPLSASWDDLARLEFRFIASVLKKQLRGLHDPVAADALIVGGVLSRDEAEAIIKVTGGSLARIQTLANVEERATELAALLALPRNAFPEAMDRYRQRLQQINPVLVSSLDSLSGIKIGLDRALILWKMLLAARLKLDGRDDEFRAVIDPYGTGPFEVHPTTGGFELRSAFKGNDDRPAVLLVGEI